ncbi:hypothetical protein EsH8_XIV_000037 [Colletotrichum jinshuiense]
MASYESLPTIQTALKVVGSEHLVASKDATVPSLDRSELLVRVECASINQVDSNDVDADQWNIGDRVMGGIFGKNPLRKDNGAFAEYAAIPARLAWKIPAGMEFTTVASLPAALATVGLSLFQYMHIAMPDAAGPLQLDLGNGENPTYVLVYGGGTATGAMALHVLKLLGYTPITTCSAASVARSLELGAAATFDYRSPNCGTDILTYTAGALRLTLDCISDSDSLGTCYKALGPAGGRYVALDPFPSRGHTRRSVEPDWVCCYTQFGHDVAWAPPFDLEARIDDRICAEAWYVLA